MAQLFPGGLGGIVFDCDGVMIESRAANIFYYNRILECFGMPAMTPEQEVFAHMAAARQVVEYLLPPDCLARLDTVLCRHISYRRDILPRITLMPGFVDFVMVMKESLDLAMAISTNRTTEGVEDVLQHFSLPDVFSPIMTASNSKPKPHPEAMLAVCRAWDMSPERVLMVGDSPSDRDAARAAGVRFCAFGDSDLDGDIKVSDYTALQQILQKFMIFRQMA